MLQCGPAGDIVSGVVAWAALTRASLHGWEGAPLPSSGKGMSCAPARKVSRCAWTMRAYTLAYGRSLPFAYSFLLRCRCASQLLLATLTMSKAARASQRVSNQYLLLLQLGALLTWTKLPLPALGRHSVPVLISYAYYESTDIQSENLDFFIRTGWSEAPRRTFVFVVAGEQCAACEAHFPEASR